MIGELFSSAFGLTVVLPPVLCLVAIVVGMAGHVVGLWDLNGGPDRGTGPVAAPVRTPVPAKPRRAKLTNRPTAPIHAVAERCDRGRADLEPELVDLDALTDRRAS